MVTFARFSDDGNLLMTGSSDNKAKIWDLSGSLVYELLGHTNDVTSGFISDYDDFFITASIDGTVRTWVPQEYENLILEGHSGRPVTGIALHPDEKYLLSCGMDSTLIIWDLVSSKPISTLPLGALGISYAIFSDSGDYVLGINKKNQSFIWKWPDNEPIYLLGHTQPVEWALFFKDNIISASQDSTLRYWNKSGKMLKTIKPGDGKLLSLAASNKSNVIAVGSEHGNIFLYNAEGKLLEVLKGHKDNIIYLDFSIEGKLVSASKDKTAIIWDIPAKKRYILDQITCAPYYKCQVNSAVFSNNGNYVVTTSSDNTVRVWTYTGELHAVLNGHTSNVINAYFAPNDLVIYTFSEDKTLRLWDLEGNEIAVYSGHRGKINEAWMDKGINKIFTASDDGTIRMWLTPRGIKMWLENSDFYQILKSDISILAMQYSTVG